ncbi:hypothetical protein MNBD_GAMMA11-3430 [hydrothermal vent metagenome]|uniref:Uncharacterized protein n=1 Tax=hydrothermal vent metagenome TaxID=652676 RepID=A0A3B0Y3G7_9ZZZZ
MNDKSVTNIMDESQKLQANTKRMWLKHNLKNGLEYIDRNFKLVIPPIRHSNFSIYLYPCYPNTNTKLYIYVDFCHDHYKIIDLLGNGESSKYQDQGYGTLLVNLALQVMRCFSDKKILVKGNISNLNDNDLEKSSSRRHHFWQSFGFKLKSPELYNTPMQAHLNNLNIIDRGMIQHSLSTTLNLHIFYSFINRPTAQESDVTLINNLDLELFSTKQITKYNIINKIRLHSIKWANRLAYSSIIIFIAGTLFLFYPLSTDQLKWFSVLSIVALLFIPNFLTYRLAGFLPGYRRSEKQNKKRLESILSIRNELISLEKKRGGFIWRIYNPLAKIDPTIKNKAFDKMANLSKNQHFELINYQHYGEMLSLLNDKLEKNYLIQPDHNKKIEIDFLFDKYSPSINIKQLEKFAKNLTKTHYIQHVNRLLKKIPQNNLVVNSDNSGFYEFPTLINRLVDDISQIELYVYGEPYWEMQHLYIKLYLSDGVLDFQTMMCTWKQERSDELVNNLCELWRNNLISRTYTNIDYDGIGRYEKKYVSEDPKTFLMDIFNMMNTRWITASDINQYQKKLNDIIIPLVNQSTSPKNFG